MAKSNAKYLLCGFMGAGKTTLMMRLANNELHRFVDLDQYFHERLGLAPGAFIEREGVSSFREQERELLAELLSFKEIELIALGGGALEWRAETLFEAQERGELVLVWLATPIDCCLERLEGDQSRPLLKLGRERLTELYQSRIKQYQRSRIHLSVEEQDQIQSLDDLHAWQQNMDEPPT